MIVQKLLWIVSAFILIQNGTIVWVHSNVTNAVNIWFILNLWSNKSTGPHLQNMTSRPLWPGALFQTYCEFSGQETSSLFQTDQQNGTRLYLREVIPLIYKTPKQFPSPSLSWCYPLQKDSILYTGLTCTHGTRRKTNSGHLNINQPAFCLNGKGLLHSSAQARPATAGITCSAIWTGDLDQKWGTTAKQTTMVIISAGILS